MTGPTRDDHVIRGGRRTVTTGTDAEPITLLVTAYASQNPDGGVVDEDGDRPLIYIDRPSPEGFTVEVLTVTVQGAKDLARALTAATDEIDGWAAQR